MCGRRRVARLMRKAGLTGQYRRRRHHATIPHPHAVTRPDLVLRDFQPDPAALGTRWCGDLPYIATSEGWLYLATVIDIASHRSTPTAAAITATVNSPPRHTSSDSAYRPEAPDTAGTTPSLSRSSPP
ncbi:hypothetical protein [Streptomyces djakartensis]|uniref:hypothetical protein n=1 Tax=Streptomyces djakartensis TaxID=68193 RepID=UPI003F7DC6D3